MNVHEDRALVLITFFLAATLAWADGDPEGSVKMHWPQPPDLTETGLDIDATGFLFGQNHLGDDYLCTTHEPVTDIHVWGSFLDDEPPLNALQQPDPRLMAFRLSIHTDIPLGGTGPDVDPDFYSRPGEVLWERQFTFLDPEYQVRLWADGLGEQYWDPSDPSQPMSADTVCWQFNFSIDEADAFHPSRLVYWLAVQAWDTTDSGAHWGWKTTNPVETFHFNDDAVFWDPGVSTEPELAWSELRYPVGHPHEGQALDLAFLITPEPATSALIGLGACALAFCRRRR